MRKEKEIRTFNKKFDKFLEKNNITYSKNPHNVSIIFCFHELGDETLEIKVLDIAAIGLKILKEILLEYVEKQKELYKKETVKMAKVTKCDVCGNTIENVTMNRFTVDVHKSFSLYDPCYDICVECMNKIRDFCSDINANYKKILDNIL